jgi:Fe-S cluster biogenesis protein NfuA/nitrite reductase/ring-hydroxylating ferredoxin subunit
MSTTVVSDPDELLVRVQDLQARLDSSGDPQTRELAEELVSAVVQMYGDGLTRIVGSLLAAGDDGERLAAALADDPVVATLLLIHDLHPAPIEDRVNLALEQVRPYMESHGGDVELLSLQDGVARIRLQGSCSDCSASAVTLELAIKQALEDAAPDLDGLEVEGVAPAAAGPALPMANGDSRAEPSTGAGMELPMVMSQPAARVATPSWFEVDHLDLLPAGKVVAAEVAGAELVVANVDGTLLAYRDACAACDGPLHGGVLQEGTLSCPQCGRTFFLPRAGRSMDADRLQLEPVPLLREQGCVKVALAA